MTAVFDPQPEYSLTQGEQDPTVRMRLAQLLLSKTDRSGECWLWQGAKDMKGYGRLRCNGRWIRAHRLSYLIFLRRIPAEMVVCHRCDTPGCINPDHLFLGSMKENMADMARKGRAPWQKRRTNRTDPPAA